MVYKIDPEADRQYLEEFRLAPIGAHSPGLMRLLNIMRVDPTCNQIILICREPFAKWVLANMPPRRGDPIVFEEDRVFFSREEAEWEVFCRRWRAHTGENINRPYRDPLVPKG